MEMQLEKRRNTMLTIVVIFIVFVFFGLSLYSLCKEIKTGLELQDKATKSFHSLYLTDSLSVTEIKNDDLRHLESIYVDIINSRIKLERTLIAWWLFDYKLQQEIEEMLLEKKLNLIFLLLDYREPVELRRLMSSILLKVKEQVLTQVNRSTIIRLMAEIDQREMRNSFDKANISDNEHDIKFEMWWVKSLLYNYNNDLNEILSDDERFYPHEYFFLLKKSEELKK